MSGSERVPEARWNEARSAAQPSSGLPARPQYRTPAGVTESRDAGNLKWRARDLDLLPFRRPFQGLGLLEWFTRSSANAALRALLRRTCGASD